MTELLPCIYAFEKPSMAFGIDVNNYGDESELMYMLSMEDISDDESDTEEKLITKKLPPGNWRFICKYPGCTEEQAVEVVQRHHLYKEWWRNYERGRTESYYSNPIDSLASLLLSKRLDTNKHFVILKKEDHA